MKNNIQDLIDLLSQTTKFDYNKLIRNFNFKAIDFKHFETWSKEHYTRNCIYKDKNFEFILLCWEQGQETSVHDHNQEDCWVYLLEGKIDEVYFKLNSENELVKTSTVNNKPNDITFMNDTLGFHKLKNTNIGRSVSLHIYAKPIGECSFFDKKSKTFVKKELKYDSFKV